jgi:hypothetical protein
VKIEQQKLVEPIYLSFWQSIDWTHLSIIHPFTNQTDGPGLNFEILFKLQKFSTIQFSSSHKLVRFCLMKKNKRLQIFCFKIILFVHQCFCWQTSLFYFFVIQTSLVYNGKVRIFWCLNLLCFKLFEFWGPSITYLVSTAPSAGQAAPGATSSETSQRQLKTAPGASRMVPSASTRPSSVSCTSFQGNSNICKQIFGLRRSKEACWSLLGLSSNQAKTILPIKKQRDHFYCY